METKQPDTVDDELMHESYEHESYQQPVITRESYAPGELSKLQAESLHIMFMYVSAESWTSCPIEVCAVVVIFMATTRVQSLQQMSHTC